MKKTLLLLTIAFGLFSFIPVNGNFNGGTIVPNNHGVNMCL
ncbi:UNVERIFIED_CONTAM: hypothetical protein ABIC26_002735 [Paenibacillus sp. PvR008]